jgi:hypothetical protein
MPIQKIGKMFRWGKKGKLYRSKTKARLQGIAITLAVLNNKRRYKNV